MQLSNEQHEIRLLALAVHKLESQLAAANTRIFDLRNALDSANEMICELELELSSTSP